MTTQANEKHLPIAVRHKWKSNKRSGDFELHKCAHCRMRTANEPLYRNEVCPARDRRKGRIERRAAQGGSRG